MKKVYLTINFSNNKTQEITDKLICKGDILCEN